MADDSQFGGGINASMTPDADTGAPPAAAPAPSQFGASFGTYQAAPEGSDPLDIAANQLQQRIQRAQELTTGARGAMINLFNPEARQHNLDLITQGTEALQKIQTQKATIAANRQEAQNLGLAPGEAPDLATHEQRVEFAKAAALKGDLRKFTGLQVVDPKAAESIQDRVYETMSGHLTNAQAAYDKLSMANNSGEYNAALKSLRTNGTLTDIEALGFKAPDGPKGFEQFNATKGAEGQALRNAKIHMDSLGQQLEARNTTQPMEKKEAETYDGAWKTAYGDTIGGQVSRVLATGARGNVIDQYDDPRKLGRGAVLASPEQRKQMLESAEAVVPKDEMAKYRAENRTYDLATKAVDTGKINTNPNIQQGIAEGLASMLRGGNGGANVGLLKIETGKRGYLQALADKITTEKAAIINELKGPGLQGKDVAPYLTNLTQQQMRTVLDGLKAWNDESIRDRIEPIAERAGALGLGRDALGLGRNESSGVIDDALERGRQAEIALDMRRHQAIGGGRGMLLYGALRPADNATGLPAGQPVRNQLPGAAPLLTPAQQAVQGSQTPPVGPGPAPQAPSPGSPAPGPGGGGAPPAPVQPVPGAGARAGGPPPSPFDGGAAPFQPSPDPVTHTMNGIAAAVHQFAASNGGTPGEANAEVQKIATNPRIEKELATTGQVQGKTVAAALGAGGNKSLVQHLTDFMNKWYQGAQNGPATSTVPSSPEENAADTQRAGDIAPAAGGTIGGAIGTLGGPGGTMAGGAIGSMGGQVLKDYLQGRPQDPVSIAEQGALGGVFGVVPGGGALRSAAGTLARVGGAAVVGGAAEAARGGDLGDIAEKAMDTGQQAVLGEAFGRALGMAGHKLWKMFGGEARSAIEDAAKMLSTAKETLATTEARIAGPNGVVDNPAYAKAEADVQRAEATIKDAGLKPEEVEYAYKVSSEPETSRMGRTEAQAARPGEVEKKAVTEGYEQLRSEVGEKGVGAPKASPKLTDGPVAAVESGAVSKQHRELAQRTEAAITAPAPSWQAKWDQLQEARSALLTQERDALTSTAPGRTQMGKDMRTLADTIRAQQVKVAEAVFGKAEGAKVIDRLKMLDTRYRNLMEATNGGDVVGAARLTGEEGRKADRAFRAFAQDDKMAIAAWNSLRSAKSNVEKDVRTQVGGEGISHYIPGLGFAINSIKLIGAFKEFLAERASGSPVKFADLVKMREGPSAGTMGAATAQRFTAPASQQQPAPTEVPQLPTMAAR